jgi:hypothetical protein
VVRRERGRKGGGHTILVLGVACRWWRQGEGLLAGEGTTYPKTWAKLARGNDGISICLSAGSTGKPTTCSNNKREVSRKNIMAFLYLW